jgi:hypothetical protein
LFSSKNSSTPAAASLTSFRDITLTSTLSSSTASVPAGSSHSRRTAAISLSSSSDSDSGDSVHFSAGMSINSSALQMSAPLAPNSTYSSSNFSCSSSTVEALSHFLISWLVELRHQLAECECDSSNSPLSPSLLSSMHRASTSWPAECPASACQLSPALRLPSFQTPNP